MKLFYNLSSLLGKGNVHLTGFVEPDDFYDEDEEDEDDEDDEDEEVPQLMPIDKKDKKRKLDTTMEITNNKNAKVARFILIILYSSRLMDILFIERSEEKK
jgi:hypothetical protein